MALSRARALEGCGAPSLLSVAERRAGPKVSRGAAGVDYGGPTGLPTQHTSCRSRHTMHVVSREPEMR